jgi:hypothetical protein
LGIKDCLFFIKENTTRMVYRNNPPTATWLTVLDIKEYKVFT